MDKQKTEGQGEKREEGIETEESEGQGEREGIER